MVLCGWLLSLSVILSSVTHPYCSLYQYFIPFFFGHTLSTRKFPGQGSNLNHSSVPSCCSDNARSLTTAVLQENSNSSFLLLMNNIPLYRFSHICLSIHQLINIWVVSTLCLFWITLLWTLRYKFLCEHKFSLLSWYMPRIGIIGSYGNCMFNLLRNYQTCFPKRLHHFVVPRATCEGSNFSASSPALVVCLFDYKYPNGREVVCYCYCCLILHFLDCWWCSAPFYVLIGYLYVFLEK